MSRRRVALLFGLCAAALLGVMAWLTANVRRLQDDQRRSREEAVRGESVRLALWRMESRLVPLMAQENARSAFDLASDDSPLIRLRFEWDASGQLRSPRSVPPPRPGGRTNDRSVEPTDRLRALARLVERSALLARINAEWLGVERAAPPVAHNDQPALHKKLVEATNEKKDERLAQAEAVQQMALNRQEWQARSENVAANIDLNAQAATQSVENRRPTAAAAPIEVKIARLQPVWVGQEIVLARRVLRGKQESLQGCWLDWPALRSGLLESIRDLLPDARLEAARESEAEPGDRLAALPIRLIPGRPAMRPPADTSALRLPLVVAWVFAAVAVVAVGALILGVATLSERRAAFVSAVTHELRTPLTTFRIYSDMLAEGMVRDDQQKQEYLTTLQREAERQSHLVENVLAYSRLERGRYTASRESVSVEDLLRALLPTLAAQAERAGMQLVPLVEGDVGSVVVQVDRSAVERILFNLVDNAGKYAHGTPDPRIHLACDATADQVRISVADHGPGIARKELRRLFRPFHKSAREASQSAPGVGLGLALSRRLARAIGGDLEFVRGPWSGARFRVRLPRGAKANTG